MHGRESPAVAEERGRFGALSVFAGGEWPVSAMLWPGESPRVPEIDNHVRFLMRVRVVQAQDCACTVAPAIVVAGHTRVGPAHRAVVRGLHHANEKPSCTRKVRCL